MSKLAVKRVFLKLYWGSLKSKPYTVPFLHKPVARGSEPQSATFALQGRRERLLRYANGYGGNGYDRYGNGDAHLKNFSLQKIEEDYILTPAYDLLNTSIHIEGIVEEQHQRFIRESE